MTYIDKTNKILSKLKETNYDLFDGDKDDALNFLTAKLEKFPNYANVVIREQILMPIWKNRFDGQELRDKISDIDSKRRMCHEAAISSVDILNRMSKNLGLEPFANIDTTDRYAVADFVGQYINEVYNNGIGKTFDSATYEKTSEYNTKVIENQIFEKTEQDESGPEF